MRDIDEKIYEILDEIKEIDNVYKRLPGDFVVEENDNFVIFREESNLPVKFSDGDELGTEIIYNIDIYSKEPDTHIIRSKINKELKKINMIRITGGGEEKDEELYVRNMMFIGFFNNHHYEK